MWNDVEWNLICRVCLQDGEMTSIYEIDTSSKTLKEKIMTCSPIKFEKESNLPEQICSVCLVDLTTAYRFYSNCESTEAVLRSIQENLSESMAGESDDKSVIETNVKEEPLTDEEIDDEIDELDDPEDEQDDDPDEENVEFLDSIGYSDNSQSNTDLIEPVTVLNNEATDEYVIRMLKDENQTNLSDIIQEEVEPQPVVQNIRAVRSNKFRMITKKVKPVATVEDITTHTDQNGVQTTVIRMRNIKEESTQGSSGKPPKICEICGNTYKYRHALESHMRRHRGEKPFACTMCDKAFVIAFELKRHMRTHTGQKPYQCKYCERKFSDFGSRIKHERSHTGERPYRCTQCGKNFAYSHVLSSHMLTHTGEKKYHCEECGKRFTKGHHLKAHKNTHTRALMKSTGNKVQKSATAQKIVTIHSNSISTNCEPNSEEHVIFNSMLNKLEGLSEDSMIVITPDRAVKMAGIKIEMKTEDLESNNLMDHEANIVSDDIIEDDDVEEAIMTEINHRDVILIE